MNYQALCDPALTYSPIFARQNNQWLTPVFSTPAGSLLHTQSSFCSQFIIPPLWKVRSKAKSKDILQYP